MPDKQPKKERLVLAQFQKFWSMVSGLSCFRVVVKQSIVGEGYGRAKLLPSWRPENRKRSSFKGQFWARKMA